jgi:hypothetical protein
MSMIPVNIEDLTERQTKDLLIKIINELDDLSCNDFFGTEGWKHFMGFED